MPELPEITIIASQMNKEIAAKSILNVEVNQPKNLNVPISAFMKTVQGKSVKSVSRVRHRDREGQNWRHLFLHSPRMPTAEIINVQS